MKPPLQMYSVIKLHKLDYRVRPIVSDVTAPAFIISRRLINLIKNTFNFGIKYCIKNSYELVEKIRTVQLSRKAKFISLNEENLFLNLSHSDKIQLVANLLDQSIVNLVNKSDILNTLAIGLAQNYF